MLKTLIVTLALILGFGRVCADDLAASFVSPPASSRPWVYWFWNNGNVTRAGITADLEAMQRVGIGGVIIMDVVERFAPPPGTADYMNDEWRELFQFSVTEANRLGLEINITNGPGWCGSSGPWITPERSMQKLVASEIVVQGPSDAPPLLPGPVIGDHRAREVFDSTVSTGDFYRDVVVLAYPKTAGGIVRQDQVLNLSANLAPDGTVKWKAPAGEWILQRIGHTSTGSSTRPPVKGGNGLECDKLDPAAMDLHFANMLGKLIARAGPMTGSTLSATHIDSWEVGLQDWTTRFAAEFQTRRGYDPLPWLPLLSPQGASAQIVVGSQALSDRFLWDFRQTRSELLAENYAGRLATLAHAQGMRLTLEGYNLPFGDEATYTAFADEPMTEFWSTGGTETLTKARQMASVAHVMGRKVVGAEAFTADEKDQWRMHPATVKALGDYQLSQGVNRFVFHRYAHQPWLDKFPGATMGPWGLHYERTQTWWEMSGPWHQYLSRCQHLLRQGLFVADVCYLRPEAPDQTYLDPSPSLPAGYRYDECSSAALISRMSVKEGRLVLPDGMSYRLLVLPEHHGRMTPALAAKIRDLVAAGATVMGEPPVMSPGLSGYPACDAEVAAIAAEVWGVPAQAERALGKGRVVPRGPLPPVLEALGATPDFASNLKLNWIHRRVEDREVYFIANPLKTAMEFDCHFRVRGLRPELWNPETGTISPVPMFSETPAGTSLTVHLNAGESAFIVFAPPSQRADPVARFTRDGMPVAKAFDPSSIVITSAVYGIPGDPARTRDVASRLKAIAASGRLDFQVAELAEDGDPAPNVKKTAAIEFTVAGESHQVAGQDGERIGFISTPGFSLRPAYLESDSAGGLSILAFEPGNYEISRAAEGGKSIEVGSIPPPRELTGSWDIGFPPLWGAPEHAVMDRLESWSDSPIEGIRHFSGTATYTTTFDWRPEPAPPGTRSEIWLDLGEVEALAAVKLNGHDLGNLWHAPFRCCITGALAEGENRLEIRVANLWPNRMIGDAAVPENQRFTWSSWQPFKSGDPLLRSGLLGPVKLSTAVRYQVR